MQYGNSIMMLGSMMQQNQQNQRVSTGTGRVAVRQISHRRKVT